MADVVLTFEAAEIVVPGGAIDGVISGDELVRAGVDDAPTVRTRVTRVPTITATVTTVEDVSGA